MVDKFDYMTPLLETDPNCVINHILQEFYPPHTEREFEYRTSKCEDIPVLCVLIQKPFLSRLLIYYQNEQWQYVRYDFKEDWVEVECMFLELRDCVDIFDTQKILNRFIRSVWNCHNDWQITGTAF